MKITVTPVATVHNSRKESIDDNWKSIVTEIELAPHIPTQAFDHISDFSHLEIIYSFNKVNEEQVVYSGHPRENLQYPAAGIFAQRKKERPNRIGLCTVKLLGHKGRTIFVEYLDAIDGTSVLDIKPVYLEFEPVGKIKQPIWVNDVMKDYWK